MAIAAEAQFHVLAVDDSPIDRKLIERLLKASSFLVTTVDSGSKALEFLGLPHSEVQVNMVITDYCMPEMSGFDLLKRIKDSSVLKDIPVVIMSSENVPSRINSDQRCLEEGADEFILKPVTPSDMNRLRPHIVKWKSGEQPKSNSREQDLICTNISGKSYANITNGDTKSSKSSSIKRKSMREGISPCKCEWMRNFLLRRRGHESQERMAAFGRIVIFENILIGPVMNWRAVKFPSFFLRPLSLFSFLTFLVFFWLISLLVTGKSDNLLYMFHSIMM